VSTPVTAEEVMTGANIWHDKALCTITDAHTGDGGAIVIAWTEELCGREAYFKGSFTPGAYFGEETIL
jgi:hypothetical protein